MWFHPETQARLATELELPVAAVPAAMGDDVRQTWVGNNSSMEGRRLEKDGERFTDAWGVEWVKSGPFNEIAQSPLSGADATAVEDYVFPDEEIDRLVARMDAVMAGRGQAFIGCDVSPCVFEAWNRIRGMEDAMFDLRNDPLERHELAQSGEASVELERLRGLLIEFIEDRGGEQVQDGKLAPCEAPSGPGGVNKWPGFQSPRFDCDVLH